MAYRTSMVKDLSIALEAVSRINNEGSADLYYSIEQLLKRAIQKVKEEDKAPTTTDDDEIPF